MSFARLSRLIRTATFRLAAIYAGIFAVSVAIIGVVVFFAMSNQGKEIMRHRVRAEIRVLSGEQVVGGVARMVATAERRALGGQSLHYLIVEGGRRVFGDLALDDLALGDRRGWFATTLSKPGSGEDGDPALAQRDRGVRRRGRWNRRGRRAAGGAAKAPRPVALTRPGGAEGARHRRALPGRILRRDREGRDRRGDRAGLTPAAPQ